MIKLFLKKLRHHSLKLKKLQIMVHGVIVTDVQKVFYLKHTWEFVLDKDVVANQSDCYVFFHIARIVNEGFFINKRHIRDVPSTIDSSSYIPELDVKEHIRNIVISFQKANDITIKLCLYCMKTQIFVDGNKGYILYWSFGE